MFLLAFLAACESPLEPEPLPQDTYPLQIASATVTADTRLADAGVTTSWTDNDQIAVSLDGETPATYTYNYTDNEWKSDAPLYWTSKADAAVTAWYPTTADVPLADQSAGLAYVLQAATTTPFGQPVSLRFTHQLAKVRVTLGGTQAGQVNKVEVNNYTACTHTQGGSVTPGTAGWITMHAVDAATYEANVVPVTAIDPANFIRLNGTTIATVNGITALEAATMYTVSLTVKSPIPDDAREIPADGTISDDGNYVVSDSRTAPITITGGKPHVYLNNAHISVNSGSAISVTGDANATIHVLGENSVDASYSGLSIASGIYVATGSSVTITGNSKEEDVLRVTGGDEGAAIGGYHDGYISATNCGAITISNVTVYAEAGDASLSDQVPGIGSTGDDCGTITITDAIVYARSRGGSDRGAPAIGAFESVPEIVITNSEVHAQRSSVFGQACGDYIGRGGGINYDYQGGAIQCGTGSITNSTIYKETYNWGPDENLSDDGTVYYNDQGIPEEKTE